MAYNVHFACEGVIVLAKHIFPKGEDSSILYFTALERDNHDVYDDAAACIVLI